MAGSVYTYTGNADPSNKTGSIQVSQGIVNLRQSGLFLPTEYQACVGEGLLLSPGPAASPAVQLTAITAVAGSAGNPNGVYRYTVTFVTAAGETVAGPETTVTLTSQQGNLSAIPVGSSIAGVTARKIYRTLAGGATGTERLVGTISDNTTTVFVDNIADGSLGAAVPTVDTAGVIGSGGSVAPVSGISALLGTDGTVGGPGGSPLTLSVGTVSPFAPTTAYRAGQPALSPTGFLVVAKVAFTSGASYSAGDWTSVNAQPPTGTPGSANQLVSVAGTRVKLTAASTPVLSAVVTAGTSNTGTIVIGDATVVAALGSRVGTPLSYGDSYVIANPTDLTNWYIDSTVGGEGVTITYQS